MSKLLSPKQQLVAHLSQLNHGQDVPPPRMTHARLELWHRISHETLKLTHGHSSFEFRTGEKWQPVKIYLSPPKNGASKNRQDRNWVLNISHGNWGWRDAIPGTFAGDPDGARAAANKILGYEATWAIVGWGYEVKDR